MSHNKSRADISVDGIDWNDPHLSSLLEKTVGWQLDNRSNLSPREVQIHISSGWMTAKTVHKPALVVARGEDTMVLLTHFPIPQGEHVGVGGPQDDAAHIVWGRVIKEREGRRTEDREQGLFLSWLRLD